jgi:NACHT domain/NACHT C-terminal Helical domain 2
MPISSLTVTAAGAWLWDKYGEAVTSKTAGALKGRWDKFKWKDAAERYRAKMKKLYGTMQIMGMAKPVPLDDIFTDAYMLDKPTAFGRFDIEHLKQLSADPDKPPPEAKRVNGLRLVREKGNLFILGKPGAGKTTFLKYIALQAAEQNIDKIPIFVSLKYWADSGAELLPFITERFDICDFPDAQPFVEELLKSGNAIVLFDGLDEVNQESGQRDKQTRAMNNFVEKYDRTQCLVTCRIAASDYSFQPFTYVEIADFTEQQIQTFVGNWFRNNEGERDEETCQRFLNEFAREDNKGLRDLARTPLLLTLLCLAFNETLTFPQRRAEIYQEAVDALLKKWDSSRRIKRDEVYRKLSLGHKENMLARIAAETFEQNQYFIPQPELERLITDYVKNVPPHDTDETTDGETILKAIEAQHGIFVERAHKIYSFSHLTFQEYFTAKYIIANADKGTLPTLIKAHCADERWREVFLLTTSMLPDASQFTVTFRRRVDELLGDDKKLKSLLTWADKKSSSIKAAPWLVRPSYLFIESYYENRNSELTRVLGRTRAPKEGSDLAFDLDFDFTLDPLYASVYNRTLSRARRLGLNELEKELEALSLPADEVVDSEWEEFSRKFRALIMKHRDVGHKWNLKATQKARLADYTNSTRLLQDCLELAYMPPEEKEAMLNSLYLPPARSEEGQDG